MTKMIYAGSVGTPSSVGKAQKGSISGIGEGVYSLSMDDRYRIEKKAAFPVDNGGIICKSRNGRFIYVANESRNFDHQINGSGGGVTAFRINESGILEKINETISYGARTSYVNVTEDNKYLVASNHGSHSTVTCHYVKNTDGNYVLQRDYDDSSVVLFRLNDDGSIGEIADLQIFKGHGYWIYGGGQSTSHIHCVKVHNDIVIACNRGADEIEVMKINRETEKLDLLSKFKTRKGMAPRHLEFHPTANIIYVVNENYPCVSVYSLDSNGILHDIQLQATATDDYLKDNPIPVFTKDHCDIDEKNTSGMGDFTRIMPSDVHLSKDCKYLYVANRRMKKYNGDIAVFRVNNDYTLTKLQNYDLPGGDPRGFNILDENHIIVGLCDANMVVVLETEQGIITKEVSRAKIKSPASFAI